MTFGVAASEDQLVEEKRNRKPKKRVEVSARFFFISVVIFSDYRNIGR